MKLPKFKRNDCVKKQELNRTIFDKLTMNFLSDLCELLAPKNAYFDKLSDICPSIHHVFLVSSTFRITCKSFRNSPHYSCRSPKYFLITEMVRLDTYSFVEDSIIFGSYDQLPSGCIR